MKSIYRKWSPADLIDLIAEHPLALMVSAGGKGFHMTPLPMLADTNAGGELVRLVGHMALRNPHAAMLRQDPRAHFLFQGPQAYISPRSLSDRSWAPTWNYAVACVEAEVRFKPEMNASALQRLVAKLEGDTPGAWRIDELGDRYPQLVRHIVAFDAEVRSVEATFKLGQDEQPAVFREILAGLDSDGLRRWMERFEGRR